MFGGLKKKLEKIAMGKVTGIILTKVAKGDFGKAPQSIYWALAKKKGWIALVLGGGAAALVWGDTSGSCVAVGLTWCGTYATEITAAAALVTLYISQVDAALRMTPPQK